MRYVSKATYCSHDTSWNFVSACWNCAIFIPQFRSDYKLFFHTLWIWAVKMISYKKFLKKFCVPKKLMEQLITCIAHFPFISCREILFNYIHTSKVIPISFLKDLKSSLLLMYLLFCLHKVLSALKSEKIILGNICIFAGVANG